jgi:RNA-directed DNA polymerase
MAERRLHGKGGLSADNGRYPQGGILSPTAANMALDGLARCLSARFGRRHKVHLVRYADDFIITGASPAPLADEVQSLVEQFLRERGLTLR